MRGFFVLLSCFCLIAFSFYGVLATSASSSSSSPPVTVDCEGGTPFPAQPGASNRFFPYVRPPPSQRKLVSPAVERTLAWLKKNLADEALFELTQNTWPMTLDTTFENREYAGGKNLTFLITGDIDALWLRDSTNQALAYVSLVDQDQKLSDAILTLIARQLIMVNVDQFANAFQATNRTPGPHMSDTRTPKMQDILFEGKYEVDSLAAVFKLARLFCAAKTKNRSAEGCFSWLAPQLADLDVPLASALSKMLSALRAMQSPSDTQIPYRFERHHPNRDFFPHLKVGYTGCVRSAFRPSDDQTKYDFLIPSNLMLAVELRHFIADNEKDAAFKDLVDAAKTLRNDIVLKCIPNFAINNEKGVLVYEVDGLGHMNMMDDANVPSLLSLPYLGVTSAEVPNFEQVYAATRAFVLSKQNPFFYAGPLVAGQGSPHTPPNYVWPLALTAQLETALLSKNGSVSDMELLGLVYALKRSAAGSGVMHESFSVDSQAKCTRNWFAWASSFFGQTVLHLVSARPDLSLKPGAKIPDWFPKPFQINK